jgi:hypothetical protein
MTFTEYLEEVRLEQELHPEWRRGQTYFNVLYDHRPDLSERVRATPIDPFYSDKNLHDFLAWLGVNWKKT